MGCDGGTIPKRDELVRTKKKAEQKDKVSQRSFLWRHCTISQTPLHDPVVSCGLGRLYNKDAVILGILDKSTLPDTAKHIKSLKDVKHLNLTPNPAYETTIEKGHHFMDHQSAPYICPVIGLEMSGKFKFCYSWNCGCVVSERAMKELKSNLCHKCQQPVSDEDIIILNPAEEDIDLMMARLENRQLKLKAEKKSKKIKKEEVPTASTSDDVEVTTSTCDVEVKTEFPSTSKTTIGKHIPFTKIDKGADKKGVKRPADGLSLKAKDFKKTKDDYSVAKDPEATTVYKSLFTSSNTAKNQMKAHWVTYNPFYN